MDLTSFSALYGQALRRREAFLETLRAEQTDAYRLFHGVAEGIPGLTIDRYGSLTLAQTFRDPLNPEDLSVLQEVLRQADSGTFQFAYNHRGKTATQTFDQWHQPDPDALAQLQCREFGLKYLIRARHPGIDPWLFLDLRAGRRLLRQLVKDRSVLNLFSYTCSVGVCAAAAGASEIWNVDFAASNLDVGRRNAQLNGIPENRFRTIQEDCLPVMRQLAGLPPGGRFNRHRKVTKFDPKQFDFVLLDPPAWSKGPFGAVDVVGDYPGLFKSAVLATKPGGRIFATHHVASVDLETWIDILKRCAAKAGRPIQAVQTVAPDPDFPSFDGRHPLKIVVCHV